MSNNHKAKRRVDIGKVVSRRHETSLHPMQRIEMKTYVSVTNCKAKRKIYACGEERKPEEMDVPHESFYKVLIRAFGLGNIRIWHSGDLTRYLIWIFSGAVILISILLLVWT